MPVTMPTLTFDSTLGKVDDIRNNLSAIVSEGPHLWLGGDEGTMIERLTRDAAGDFGTHARFDLAGLLALPDQGPKPSEIDLEGLDFDSGYLWLTGSHCLKRKRPKDDPLKDLAKVERQLNRFTLGRVPLEGDEPAAKSADGRLAAGRLATTGKGNELTDALVDDAALGPFLTIPSKDNGLDIEGLAVTGNRVFVGCRGPVLRGIAIVLELEIREGAAGALSLASLGGKKLRRHFLDLGGLGVRDLVIDGADLLILAGPTMVLDGPVLVYRWPKALERSEESFVAPKDLARVLAVPFGDKVDHAEGFALVGSRRVMICYDSPGEARAPKGAVTTEVDEFDLDG